MKRITAIIITAAAFIGCSYVGTVGAEEKRPCRDLAYSVQVVTKQSHEAMPGLIKMCEMGAQSRKGGMTDENASKVANTPVAGVSPQIANAMGIAYLLGFKAGE